MTAAGPLPALFILLIGRAGAEVLPVNLGTFGAGFCIVGGPIGANAFAGALYPTSVRATGVGWALGMGRFGSVVGSMLVTALLAAHWDIATVFNGSIVPAIAAGLFFLAAGGFAPGRAWAPTPEAGYVEGLRARGGMAVRLCSRVSPQRQKRIGAGEAPYSLSTLEKFLHRIKYLMRPRCDRRSKCRTFC